MTYEEALHALASWAGRYVLISVRPSASPWQVAHLGGLLPQGVPNAEAVRELDGEWWSFRFTHVGWVHEIVLRRDQFCGAELEEERRLVIELEGITLDVFLTAPPGDA